MSVKPPSSTVPSEVRHIWHVVPTPSAGPITDTNEVESRATHPKTPRPSTKGPYRNDEPAEPAPHTGEEVDDEPLRETNATPPAVSDAHEGPHATNSQRVATTTPVSGPEIDTVTELVAVDKGIVITH